MSLSVLKCRSSKRKNKKGGFAYGRKQNKIERAQRTRRLIENGALAEKYLNCDKIEPAEFEKLLKQLVQIEQVKALVSAPKNGGVNE